MKNKFASFDRMIPASKIQEHFWVLNQLNTEDTAYNISSVFKITGSLNIEFFKKALVLVINKHDALRTNFMTYQNALYQCILPPIDFFDLQITQICESYTLSKLPKAIRKEINKTFDLYNDHLIRVRVFITIDNDFFLTIVFHHIIVDLHSKDIFSQELSDYYNVLVGENNCLSIKRGSQYSDYCELHNKWLLSDDAAKMSSEWKSEIPLFDNNMELPGDFLNLNHNRREGLRKYFRIENNLFFDLKAFCAGNTSTPFIVLLASYAIFLHRMSGKTIISIGVPFTNRRWADFKDTFGCFVNILPIFVYFSDNPSCNEVVKRVRQSLLLAHRKQEIPFLIVQSLFNKGESAFQAGFTFEHPMHLSLNNVGTEPVIFDREGAQLDLFVTFWEDEKNLHGFFEYSKILHKENTIEHYIKIYTTILENLLKEPQVEVSKISIIPDEDLAYIMELNNTDVDYDNQHCIHYKLEQQSLKTPNAIALIFRDDLLSYTDLDRFGNNLANFLISKKIEVEDIVAICVYRSIEMIIGLFGILKSGGAYLPLNPNDPAERILSILNDAKPKVILTTKASSQNLNTMHKLVFIDDYLEHPLCEDYSKPNVQVSSQNLAYIIYTSGSTGLPKGVMIEHHSVMNRILWMQKKYSLNEFDTLMQKTPITFDVSVWELFWWSFVGARLNLLPPDEEKNPDSIIQEMKKNAVSVIHFVPSMFNSFLGTLVYQKDLSGLSALKRIFFSGEALPVKLVEEFNILRSDTFSPDLINLYGPTEATVDVSYYDCPKSNIQIIYIGKPIDNTKLFVVSNHKNIQPIGLQGELVISGVNLARGYLNRPELTTEKFITLKLPDNRLIRAYLTGDLAKLHHNGEIEYLGRMDNQVKIRGFRIELGEIENKILEHGAIDSCAVIMDGIDNNKKLIAYIHLKLSGEIKADSLRKFLRAKLPDYMVPTYFIFIDIIPFTSSGKFDRGALPKPEKFIFQRDIVAPITKYEKEMVNIWEKILLIDNIGIEDNFFDIGGNSLLTIQFVNEINSKLNVNFTPVDVYKYTNIRELCKSIMNNKNEANDKENISIKNRVSRMKSKILNRNKMIQH